MHFPLKPFDLLTRLPPSFVGGVLVDSVRKRFAATENEPSFASILERGLGRTICRDFYFPYAEKIWGLPPTQLDPEQAKRRVSSGSLGKMVRRVLEALPGLRRPGAGRFFYPRRGYGQLSDALHRAAVERGAAVLLEANVKGVVVEEQRVQHVEVEHAGETRIVPATQVLSTIPLGVLAKLIRANPSPTLVTAARSLQLRSMVLVYVTMETDRFTEFDAHYFPESVIRISRLSEPKNYSLTASPGRTVLCAELPCSQADAEWSMNDDALGALVCDDLERAGLGPLPPVVRVQTRRLPNAYPLYSRGYREAFDALDLWVSGFEGLVTFGRQGLFAHDNTHHVMAMAYELVDSLRSDGTLDRETWSQA
ncbi:MAG: FAD-dependent oxidoreductase, partial [Vicinamibacterales bacterium]